MKFLWRRIRYAFAGHMMRTIMAIAGIILVLAFALIMLSGAINQRNLFEGFFGFAWNSGKTIATEVDESGLPLDISDQGVYLKDHAPDGAKVYDTSTNGKTGESNGTTSTDSTSSTAESSETSETTSENKE